MSLSFPRSAQFSWGGSPEPRRAPSPGCLCSQQDPVRPTRASAAGQGSRPTRLSDIGLESAARLHAVDQRADAKLGAEGAVEVRHVTETAIEGDIENSCRLHRQPHRRFTQADPKNVPVRRHTGEALKSTQEVVWAEPRLPRKVSECEPGIELT